MRTIQVYLLQVQSNSQPAGDPIQLTGNIYGITYHNNLGDPTDQEARTPIYSFPNGPIALSPGQTVPIHTRQTDAAAITLSSDAPVIRWLQIFGELNNGLTSDAPLPFDDLNLELGMCNTDGTTPFSMTFSDGGNLKVTLTFGLCVLNFF